MMLFTIFSTVRLILYVIITSTFEIQIVTLPFQIRFDNRIKLLLENYCLFGCMFKIVEKWLPFDNNKLVLIF